MYNNIRYSIEADRISPRMTKLIEKEIQHDTRDRKMRIELDDIMHEIIIGKGGEYYV